MIILNFAHHPRHHSRRDVTTYTQRVHETILTSTRFHEQIHEQIHEDHHNCMEHPIFLILPQSSNFHQLVQPPSTTFNHWIPLPACPYSVAFLSSILSSRTRELALSPLPADHRQGSGLVSQPRSRVSRRFVSATEPSRKTPLSRPTERRRSSFCPARENRARRG